MIFTDSVAQNLKKWEQKIGEYIYEKFTDKTSLVWYIYSHKSKYALL